MEVCRLAADLNQGLMELGALICTPRNAACMVCPLRATAWHSRPIASMSCRRRRAKPARASCASRSTSSPTARGRVLMRRESGR